MKSGSWFSHARVNSVITNGHSPYKLTIADKKHYQIAFESGYPIKIIPSKKMFVFNGDSLKLKLDIRLQPFKINKPIALENILYDFSKATLRPRSKISLDMLVGILHDNPKIKVELASHNDSLGSDAYNVKLSQARAQSCVDYILSKGISEERIIPKAMAREKQSPPIHYLKVKIILSERN